MAIFVFFVFILFSWIVLITIASLLAVIPFFLLGLAGRLWEVHALRKELRAQAFQRSKDVMAQAEETIWHVADQSHASVFESPAEALRRVG